MLAARHPTSLYKAMVTTISNSGFLNTCAELPFLKEANVEFRRSYLTLAKSATQRLEGYWWPSNVRELRNTIQRAVCQSPTTTIEDDEIASYRWATSIIVSYSGARRPWAVRTRAALG